jgi:group II intron reverse transcriptase/maturase
MEGTMVETSSSRNVSTKQHRIAELAKQMPGTVITTLSHHMDQGWMQEAHRQTRKDGAVGVDGKTAQAYGEHLEGNLEDLLNRAKSGSYFAPPVRRVHLPKDGGKTRPIGIPTYEDKVLQRAVLMLLEPVYEQDFVDCSYGFRPGRGAHQALEAFWQQAMNMGGGWVLEVDIQSFYDTLDHGHLREFLQLRVRDGVVTRLIGKWLNAGVMEAGQVTHPEQGTPQGGVISPLMANIYLHEVLDKWWKEQVQPRLRGRAFEVRYADDVVLCFEREEDARKVLEVLPKRLDKYGLTLHPEKTRLVPFGQPREGGPDPGSFDFLGFTHYWGKSRKGNPVIRRKTSKQRLARTLSRINQWCRANRHERLTDQHRMLSQKLRGHYGYFGITANMRALEQCRYRVERMWRKWLSRRSQRGRVTWERFKRWPERFQLPKPRIYHSAVT